MNDRIEMTPELETKQRAMLRAMAGWLTNAADTAEHPAWIAKPLDEHLADAQAWALDQWENYS